MFRILKIEEDIILYAIPTYAFVALMSLGDIPRLSSSQIG